MRRWNGWGEEGVDVVLGGQARRLLERHFGTGAAIPDAALPDVLARVPASRLPGHPLASIDPLQRVLHARGQSLPDWIALRSGRLEAVPDAVATPADGSEVRALLEFASREGVAVVPYGGGTSVVGGVTVRPSDRPVMTVDAARLAGVRHVDERSGIARVGAGTTGPQLDGELADRRLTLGHEPQSWELSTVGGWVAARSSGQRSLAFGRIEQLFAGGTLEAPAGTLELPPFPASAAGPDLRQVVLGSEGRLGILTDVLLRTAPIPEADAVDGYALPGWEVGLEATRALARAHLPLSMLRLSDPEETAATMALANRAAQTGVLGRYVQLRLRSSRWSMLLVGATGTRRTVATARAEARTSLGRQGAIRIPGVAEAWQRNRFRTPYLRNALWDAGYAADTLETAATWDRLPALAAAVLEALGSGLHGEGSRAHAFAHLSHVYPSGSSLYVTYLFPRAADPDRTLAHWRALKAAASRAIRDHAGTISHHHGVGTDHAAYLPGEKGALGLAVLHALAATFDPAGIMNPGVLLPSP